MIVQMKYQMEIGVKTNLIVCITNWQMSNLKKVKKNVPKYLIMLHICLALFVDRYFLIWNMMWLPDPVLQLVKL